MFTFTCKYIKFLSSPF